MKTLTNNCGDCGHSYTMGAKTAELHVFTKHPGMSYIEGTCPLPGCASRDRCFFIATGEVKLSDVYADREEDAERWGKVFVEDAPSTAERMMYHKATKTEPVKTNIRLTERLAAEAERFAAFMETADDEWLLELLTAPALHPTQPVRWTDEL